MVTNGPLALPDEVVKVLLEHQAKQQRERERAGDKWQDHDLVFCTRLGGPLDAGNMRRSLRLALKAADLPTVWTPRGLRHSFVSIMTANGAPGRAGRQARWPRDHEYDGAGLPEGAAARDHRGSRDHRQHVSAKSEPIKKP